MEAWHLAINMVAFSSFAGALMSMAELVTITKATCPFLSFFLYSADVLNDKYGSAKSMAFLITAGKDYCMHVS